MGTVHEVVRTCEHCQKVVKGPVYFRWHGPKCSKNPGGSPPGLQTAQREQPIEEAVGGEGGA